MPKVSRRQLAGRVASSLAFAALPLDRAFAEAPASPPSASVPLNWESVLPGIWRATIGTAEQHTPVKTRLIGPAEASLRGLPPIAQLPLKGATGSADARGAELTLPLEAGELLYGFGLQFFSLQQRNKKRTIRVNADPKSDSGDSHAPVPFYVTSRGYGVLVDTFRHAQFYCGQAHPKPTKPEAHKNNDVVTPADIRRADRGVSGEVRVEVPRVAGVDVYLFAGPSMLNVVERYNLFSGGGVQPPEWALGFWYRPEMHLDATEVLKLAQEFRERKIPCDVLGLEPGWQTHAYSCSFAWEPTRFPDPKRFVDSVGRLDYRVNLWEHAFTHPSSPVFPALVPYSGDYAVWQGVVPDFAAEPARRIFGDYHGKALIDVGVSGFKLDECDGSDFTEGWSWPDFSRFPSGLDGEQMHGAFGLRYQHAVLEAFRKRGLSTFGLVRSSGALAAPYPFVLYSDLYDHKQFIRAMLNAGFSGLLWCPEVRDADSEEDLLRRLQSVVFSPLAMVNAWYIRNPPWKQIDRDRNNADNFAKGWESLEDRCREILGWRMSMVPYLRSAFAQYAANGTPAFRAPILDFPNDTAMQAVDDQYMMGDRLLVAPLFAGDPERAVVLPAGDWHDFWTGERVSGAQRIRVAKSFKHIPVYVRGNALVPWAEVGASSNDPATRRLRVRVYGDGSLGWQGRGPDLEGLSLTWNAANSQVHAATATHAERPYQITGWDKIG